MRIGSNLSGRQLTEPGCGQALLEIIAASGIPPEHVVLELTETVLIAQGDAVDRVFRELCDAGVTLCLDDFGSGYSSLSHLRRYPIGVVKLDTSYVQSFTTDPGALIIAEAVVQMAQRLDLMVVAEGVETDEQLAAVRELGIAKAQGYLLGRPAPAHTLLPDVVARAERYRAAPPG
jgi:EAL domain-containing protein (putative c-di-GMP-specific phosphodiesterase class I)